MKEKQVEEEFHEHIEASLEQLQQMASAAMQVARGIEAYYEAILSIEEAKGTLLLISWSRLDNRMCELIKRVIVSSEQDEATLNDALDIAEGAEMQLNVFKHSDEKES